MAERRGARLQSAPRRFDSARCLGQRDNHEGGNDEKIKTFGPVDARSLEQLERCMAAGDADYGVLCADHHPGYSQPIGGAIAYEGYVSPSGVGYDIGCGNKAVLHRADPRRPRRARRRRADHGRDHAADLVRHGRARDASASTTRCSTQIRNAEFAPQRKLAQLAESQLGTVGSGNHYVNLMEDEDGRVWVGVHFGSRGFGHKTASGLPRARAGPARSTARRTEGEMDSPPVLFEVGSELGDAYVAAMELAGEYAYAGRDVVVAKVLEILGAEAVARGAQPPQLRVAGGALRPHLLGDPQGLHARAAGPGGLRRRLDGRRVGDPRGRRVRHEAERVAVLDGARRRPRHEPHAGGGPGPPPQALGVPQPRLRPRLRHRRRQREPGAPKKGVCPDHPDARLKKVWVEEQLKPGKVDWPAVQARLREQGIVLVGGGADEAPEVYKRLPEVLAAHAGSIRVKHTLRPLGVAMAGRDVVDPYKD